MQLRKLPRVLIIQLKRFMIRSSKYLDFWRMAKNGVSILFPPELDLKSYLDSKKLMKKVYSKYELNGVVYHSGALESGHYYSRRKAPYKGKQEWFLYNDSKV